MSHIQQIMSRLDESAKTLGFNPAEVEQGSYQWFQMRLGVISASQAVNLLAKKGSAARDGYLARLVGEIATGMPQEEVTAKAMAWGKENEPKARQMYEFLTMEPVSEVPFVYSGAPEFGMRCGCSPDGVLTGKRVGIEIKCPFTTKVHIETILDSAIKKEYQAQMDFSLMVTGLDGWEFCSFDPRMTRRQLHSMPWDRNDSRIETMRQATAEFIADMDKALLSIGFEFGEQWKSDVKIGACIDEQQAGTESDFSNF